MPTDHAEVELKDVRVPADAVLGEVDHGLEVGQTFLHENRIRQAASSLGAAQYCIDRAAAYASERVVFGKPLSVNQAVQWPLVELQTEAQMVRLLVYYAAWHLDRNHHMEVSDKVSMANYRANRLVCEAADRAMQVHGGLGYSRHEPFEHIYRHHRRYRITEGAEEIQIRRVAQRMFKFGSRAQVNLDELARAAEVLAPTLGDVRDRRPPGTDRRREPGHLGVRRRRRRRFARAHPAHRATRRDPCGHGAGGGGADPGRGGGRPGARTSWSPTIPLPHLAIRSWSVTSSAARPSSAGSSGRSTTPRAPTSSTQCARALAAIHRADPTGIGLTSSDPLDDWHAQLDEMGDTTATFEWAFRWLARNRPAASPKVLVHGDFRMGNLIVDTGERPARLAAVLDWELTHAGEVYEDLAWFCIRAWRFGAPESLGAGGLGSIEEFLAAYEHASGTVLDRAAMQWWLVLSTLRWGVICRYQARAAPVRPDPVRRTRRHRPPGRARPSSTCSRLLEAS